MPLKTEPVSASESPDVSVEGAVAIRGCQALLNPRPTSYSSALLKELPLNPPATSTLPEGSSVAVCKYRAVLRLPVLLQLPVAGSYSSALLKQLPLYPPATSTLPEGSSVAV